MFLVESVECMVELQNFNFQFSILYSFAASLTWLYPKLLKTSLIYPVSKYKNQSLSTYKDRDCYLKNKGFFLIFVNTCFVPQSYQVRTKFVSVSLENISSVDFFLHIV